MDDEGQKEFREGPFSHLPFGGGELVRTAARIIKVSPYGAAIAIVVLMKVTGLAVRSVRPTRASNVAQGPRHSYRRRRTPHQPGTFHSSPPVMRQ